MNKVIKEKGVELEELIEKIDSLTGDKTADKKMVRYWKKRIYKKG